jgi:ubiquinone/menaquinone biosynthesis C-methylase UbiE
MTHRRLLTIPLVAWAAFAAAVVCAQENAADTKRFIEALRLKPGDVVAEVGAGDGELTIALAQHVGASGRVMSSELGAERVQRLRAAVEKSGAANIQVIEGDETRANFPDGCCDAIFMRNVYHHFGDPPAMHASFIGALKPGGRIAIIDFAPRKGDTAPPGKRGEDPSHGVSESVVAQELKAAGFNVVSEHVESLPARPEPDSAKRWCIVVAEKPKP